MEALRLTSLETRDVASFRVALEVGGGIPKLIYPALYWGKGQCKLSDHTWATYPDKKVLGLGQRGGGGG